MKSFIYVQTTFEGIHAYEDAPNEVAYLRNPHRHMFTVKAKIEVFHAERELEFIMVKHQLNNLLSSADNCVFRQLYNQSCEKIASRVRTFLVNTYGAHREMAIEVWEDNENGACLEWAAERS